MTLLQSPKCKEAISSARGEKTALNPWGPNVTPRAHLSTRLTIPNRYLSGLASFCIGKLAMPSTQFRSCARRRRERRGRLTTPEAESKSGLQCCLAPSLISPSLAVIVAESGGSPGVCVSSAWRIARRWAGVVPQQPPIIRAPASRASLA